MRRLLTSKSAPAPIAVIDPDPIASVPVVAAPPVRPAPVKPVAAKPTPAKIPPPKPVAAPATGAFLVQVGTFANRTNADATAKKLGGKVGGSGKLWRVQLGPFADRTAAEAGLARAKKAGFGDARIVTAGK